MGLPDFLIVGAAKAGTTSLHSYLSQHPAITGSRPKETFYFVREEVEACAGVGRRYAPHPIPRDPGEYAACFPDWSEGRVRGESCVAYLYFPEAAARIRAASPACRILIVLRNPVDRAFSNYLHHVRDGLERLSFRAAVAAGPERLRRGWWFGFDYLGGSRYADQVRHYFDHFPAAQVRVLLYDDLRRDPAGTCRAIFAFLGLDPDMPIQTGSKLNVSRVPRPGMRLVWSGFDGLMMPALRRVLPRPMQRAVWARVRDLTNYRPQLAPEDRRYVADLLRDDIQRLQEVVGKDLSGWATDRVTP